MPLGLTLSCNLSFSHVYISVNAKSNITQCGLHGDNDNLNICRVTHTNNKHVSRCLWLLLWRIRKTHYFSLSHTHTHPHEGCRSSDSGVTLQKNPDYSQEEGGRGRKREEEEGALHNFFVIS